MKKFRFQWGAFLMFIIYGGLFFLLFGRLLFIQVTGVAEGEALASLAESKYASESILPANRGEILDRNGDVIVSNTISYRLVAVLDQEMSKNKKDKYHVDDPEKTAAVLAKYLPLDKNEAAKRMTRSPEDIKKGYKKQVEFGASGRNISRETYLKIKEEKLPGILFYEETKRFYPNGSFASHLIGYAVREEDKNYKVSTVGKMGLEATFNKELTGTDGKVEFQSDKWGIALPRTEKAVVPAIDGYNIQLTIDKTIQNFVEDIMREVEEDYEPEKMIAVVADAKTGEILAMAQRPSFDPDTREGLTSNWLNEVTENTIEPGSTFKIFTLAAAIEEGKWDPDAYFESGKYQLYDQTIRDVNRTGWGTISYLEGYQRSSNVLMAHLLDRMGDETFIDYIERFGFGQQTGVDLPNEAKGIVLKKYPAERYTTSFGQGSTVTPIQMIQGVTAIANDGVMKQPYVIDKIVDPNTDKVLQSSEIVEKESPISKETAQKVREILASNITSEAGTGRIFALDGYDVGGKTGTAQIPDGYGGYLKNGFLQSFIGMAPIDDPQLITYVVVQKPKGKSGEASATPVAKIFKSVMENSLKHKNIVQSGESTIEAPSIDDYTKQDAKKAKEALEKAGYHPIIIGEGGKVHNQYPTKGAKMVEGSTVLLKTDGEIKLPDFTGWSKKMMLSFKMLTDLDIRLTGDGFVTEQSVSVDTVVDAKNPITIRLKHPSEIYKEVKEE